LVVYDFARSLAKWQRVLDLGSGTGYGTALLADSAREIIALDIAPEAVLATRLGTMGVVTVAGDGAWLPLRDEMFDLVVSVQVIEHIRDEGRYLDEVRRVLTPNGLFILATPNKALRLLPFQPPYNPYHVREYDYRGFYATLRSQFDHVVVRGVCAIPEVMAIEHERLKRNPLKVYLKLAARKTLPPPVLQGFQDRIKTLRQAEDLGSTKPESQTTPGLFSEDAYSVNDFWIGTNDVRKSLDLVGICRKS
jgi:SAM-dependent methyltransferase